MPLAIPVTIPVEPTVATEISLLLHTPPEVPSVNDIVDPTQTLVVPEIVAITGRGFIVTGLVARHPVVNV